MMKATGTPIYDNCGPYPFRLTPASPGVDAGNNAAVPAAATLDLAGAPRFLEVPSAPNSGAGTAPLVDMGAFESDPDCNANNVSDWCDIDSGTSFDQNANSVPDECECQGGVPPSVYCTAKLNSQFCLPAIAFSGYPSLSGTTPFVVRASNIINQKNGLLFYGYASNNAPFQGGTMCVLAPTRRTPVQNSAGSTFGIDCTGTFTFDMSAWITAGNDPLLQIVGQAFCCQYWSRDPQDAFFSSTTDAVEAHVCQ